MVGLNIILLNNFQSVNAYYIKGSYKNDGIVLLGLLGLFLPTCPTILNIYHRTMYLICIGSIILPPNRYLKLILVNFVVIATIYTNHWLEQLEHT